MKIKYDPTITLGNTLQVLLIAAAAAGMLIRVQNTIDRQEFRLQMHDELLLNHSRTIQSLSQTDADLTRNLQTLTAIVNERTRNPQTH